MVEKVRRRAGDPVVSATSSLWRKARDVPSGLAHSVDGLFIVKGLYVVVNYSMARRFWTCFDIRVRMTNQFGDQTLIVGRARRLCVPSAKEVLP